MSNMNNILRTDRFQEYTPYYAKERSIYFARRLSGSMMAVKMPANGPTLKMTRADVELNYVEALDAAEDAPGMPPWNEQARDKLVYLNNLSSVEYGGVCYTCKNGIRTYNGRLICECNQFIDVYLPPKQQST